MRFLVEGLVNVHVAEITTQLAFPSLVSRLEVAGWTLSITKIQESEYRILLLEGNESELANTLCGFTFDEWMRVYLENRLLKNYSYLTDEEQEYLALVTMHMVKDDQNTYAGQTLQQWKDALICTLQEMIDGSQVIDVDGVVRFRLKDFLEPVNHHLDDNVQQFLADREYEEFVSMLRYILDSQSPTNQVMHVYSSSERVWICDASGKLVRDTEIVRAVELASEGEDMNAEDLAMSILITRSPGEIIIHDLFSDALWPSFTHTVEKVFAGRATRCGGCSVCQKLELGSLHLHPLG